MLHCCDEEQSVLDYSSRAEAMTKADTLPRQVRTKRGTIVSHFVPRSASEKQPAPKRRCV